jgi:hypothetical protein
MYRLINVKAQGTGLRAQGAGRRAQFEIFLREFEKRLYLTP